MILGQDRAVSSFTEAMRSGMLHHAWLLAGPRGVGKASFAREATRRLLAEAAGPPIALRGIETPDNHPIARLLAAGSHPDYRELVRLERKEGGPARNISIEQVRSLAGLFNSTPFLSPWRAVVIDSVDDLEREGANALLKMLEEPPANTLFLLVSHASGRLLATIRSRCRRLDFQTLDDDAMTSALCAVLPDASDAERTQLVPLAAGSVGRAIAYAALDLAPLEEAATAILREGDPSNARRSKLAQGMSGKAAADRYVAFLALVPRLIAREARSLDGPRRERAIDAYAQARDTAAIARRLGLDPAATIFQLGGVLAAVAPLP